MEYNPYQAPTADVEHFESDEMELASPGVRLGARITDFFIRSIICFILIVLVMTIALPLDFGEDMFIDVISGENLWVMVVGVLNPISLLVMVCEQISFVILNGYLLATSGQTVGKKLLGIKTIDRDTHEVVPFAKIYSLRYLVWVIPRLMFLPLDWLIQLFNVIFIFSDENRTLHDRVANTIVVKA